MLEDHDLAPPAVELGRKLATQYIHSQVQAGRLLVLNHAINMNRETKVLFVHNPKCMGTSLKKWLGLPVDRRTIAIRR